MRLPPAFAAIALALAPMTVLAAPAAGDQTAPARFVTEHTGTFHHQPVRYTATVAATVIDQDPAIPPVSLFTTAYVRTDVADRAGRPVVFFFNGGPGAPSDWLNLGAFGPKRLAISPDTNAPAPVAPALVDNDRSPLDVADLVFIDPAETGFSRVLPGGDRARLYTTAGDAQSIADLIAAWLKANGREASPRYLVGESYGTIRAALVAGLMSKSLPLDGVVLVSQAVNIIETSQRAVNPVGYATNLTALAAIAAYHGRADLHGKSLSAFVDEAYAWGMGEYLEALVKGADLPAADQARIAARLQAFTGISADYYLAHHLIISKVQFRSELLRDKGLVLGVADARYTGPGPAPGTPAADPFAKVQAGIAAPLRSYLTGDLGVTLPIGDYRRQAPDTGSWVYTPTRGDGGPFADWDYPASITAAMKAKPTFRLMITTGYYDLMTAIGPAQFMVAKSDWPKDRVTLHRYVGGHMSYTHAPSLVAITDDVRAFIAKP